MTDRAARTVEIQGDDIVETVRAALQYVAVYHAPDYLAQLVEAYRREQSAPARTAIGQILQSSRLAAIGQRPAGMGKAMDKLPCTVVESQSLSPSLLHLSLSRGQRETE